MQIYTITHTKTGAKVASFDNLFQAELTQKAYQLQDCSFISCVPIAKKSLIDSISADNCFNLLCKVLYFGLPCLVGYLLLNF